jgi:hypothetical protein
MPVIYVSKQTRTKLDKYKQLYITQKHISQNVAHIISDDIVIQELMNTVDGELK